MFLDYFYLNMEPVIVKVFIKLEVLMYCIASCLSLTSEQLIEKKSCLGNLCHNNNDLRSCIHILAKKSIWSLSELLAYLAMFLAIDFPWKSGITLTLNKTIIYKLCSCVTKSLCFAVGTVKLENDFSKMILLARVKWSHKPNWKNIVDFLAAQKSMNISLDLMCK